MIYYQNPDGTMTPGTKGGSWNSIEKELEINGTDRWKGMSKPSVNIGFRMVMTYTGFSR